MTTDRGWGRRLLSLGSLGAAVVVAMILLSPSRPAPVATPSPTQTRLSAAEEYAHAALTLMGERSLFVDQVTWWPGVVRDAMAEVRPARTPAETYPALRTALAAASDQQGELLTPQDVPQPEIASLPTVSASGGIGRLSVASIGPVSTSAASARATALADSVGLERAAASCGWLIDLRETHSQEDWGLLAGLHSFLREGELFQLRDRNGKAYHVTMAMGSVFLGGQVMATADRERAGVDEPVAVLQSGRTAGVGEALVLALRQDDRTRTFGVDTGGLPFTERFTLSDGAELVLPTARLTDRAGHDYTHGLPAQVGTEDPERTALAWLRSQCKQT